MVLYDDKLYVFKKLEVEGNEEKVSFRDIIRIYLESWKYLEICCFYLRCEY